MFASIEIVDNIEAFFKILLSSFFFYSQNRPSYLCGKRWFYRDEGLVNALPGGKSGV